MQGWQQTLRHWFKHPLFAYLMLVLLQLKTIWGMWQYRDLTSGDTSNYFQNGYRWFENFQVNIVWSPLYTAFYGTLLFFSRDVYTVTILHRIIIVFAVAILVLALMRRLLPHGLAWLMAAWWVILPINFNTLYEVHLFAVIPILAAWLLILALPNSWGRGGAIATLFGAAVLVRNELIIATLILAVICFGWEILFIKKHNTRQKPLSYLFSYGSPLLLAGLICFFFYTRSTIQFPNLPAASLPKHTVNMCQVYAFGYQQRHPEWTKSPWTECYELMEQDFGERLLPLSEMLRKNPTAVLTHFWWNLSLAPNGLQVLLFNATSGAVNPDYVPVQFGSLWALLLSLIVAAIIVVGLILLYRERCFWWNFWLQDRVLGWLAMLAVMTVTFIIIPTQRPRPSYLFSLSIFLMALTGMSIFITTYRWPRLYLLSGWMPFLMAAILVVAPSYYANPAHRSPRRVLEAYQKLAPFQEIIVKPDTIFLKGEVAGEIKNYLGHGLPQVINYNVLTNLSSTATLQTFLNNEKINLIYIDEILAARYPELDPFTPSFSTMLQSAGWKLIAFQDIPGDKWMLWQKIE